MNVLKRTLPSIPVDHPKYVWTPHGDVMSVWKRFGWVPPSESKSSKVKKSKTSKA